MKRYYRRRIMGAAMLAFVILLTLVIGGIYLFSFLQMERTTDGTVQSLLTQDSAGEQPFRERGFPGNMNAAPGQPMFASTFYEIEADSQGNILSAELRGFLEDSEIDLNDSVAQILARGKDSGKLGAYKYGVQATENGFRVILLNISIQLQMLYSILFSALIIGLILAVLLLIILLPVSAKAAELIIRNTEKQKRFITDAGHELKTPVAVIRSNLDVMELLDGKSKWSGNIRGQVDRLEGLVKQLLLLARLDEKQWTGRTENIDLTQLLEDELAIYMESMDQKELTLRSDIDRGLRLACDKDALCQMIHAVMDNAVQYTPAQGVVQVSCLRERKLLRLEITNTVDALPQIPPEQLTDRFTRGDTARSRKTGGTGIGLSTAKSVAEMLHGAIRINYLDGPRFQVAISMPAS